MTIDAGVRSSAGAKEATRSMPPVGIVLAALRRGHGEPVHDQEPGRDQQRGHTAQVAQW